MFTLLLRCFFVCRFCKGRLEVLFAAEVLVYQGRWVLFNAIWVLICCGCSGDFSYSLRFFEVDLLNSPWAFVYVWVCVCVLCMCSDLEQLVFVALLSVCVQNSRRKHIWECRGTFWCNNWPLLNLWICLMLQGVFICSKALRWSWLIFLEVDLHTHVAG